MKNVYVLGMQNVGNIPYIEMLCKLLGDRLPLDDVTFWFVSLGKGDVTWADRVVEEDEVQKALSESLHIDKFPKVRYLHIEGYQEFDEAADQICSICVSRGGEYAILLDMEAQPGNIVNLAYALSARHRATTPAVDCMTFCTSAHLIAELAVKEKGIDCSVTILNRLLSQLTKSE